MDGVLEPGKLPAELLAALLREFADSGAAIEGRSLPSVRLGPAIGEDACAIDLPKGTLVAATDPITLAGSEIGAFAVTINANDIAVMGVRPRWFMAAILMPVGTRESDVRELFASMSGALDAIGATLVGGHTEITAAVSQPVVVGQMMGLCEDGHIVPTGGVGFGDVVVQVGPAPIEAAVVLAELAARDPAVSREALARARAALHNPGISVVEAALLAARCGATAMHDPTEGGLSAGLYELANASGVALQIDETEILWFEPGVTVCRAVGANPWGALASGALLATFRDDRVDAALRSLADAGLEAARIGAARYGHGVQFQDGRKLIGFSRDEVARVSALESNE